MEPSDKRFLREFYLLFISKITNRKKKKESELQKPDFLKQILMFCIKLQIFLILLSLYLGCLSFSIDFKSSNNRKYIY